MTNKKSYFDSPQEPLDIWWKKMAIYEPFNQEMDRTIYMMMGEYR